MRVASALSRFKVRVALPVQPVQASFEVSQFGLSGDNITLALVACLWKRLLTTTLLGMFLTVSLTELVPVIGLLAPGWLETSG